MNERTTGKRRERGSADDDSGAAMKERQLADLINLQSGFAFKSQEYTENGHFLVRIGNVQDGYLSLDHPKYVALDGKTERFALDEGDFLTSLTGNIGRVARVEKAHLPAALNQRVARLKVRDASTLSADYLFYFLSSDLFRKELCEGGHGAAQQNVSPSAINGLAIPLPPLPEQRRIVGILDKAFASIATAKANAEKNLQNARALFESHLNAVFTQRGDGWVEDKLQALTTKIGSGATPRGGANAYKSQGISLIRSLNVHDLRFRYEKLAFIDEAQADKLSNVEVQSRDVLLNITGASVARCSIAPADVLPARVNQHVSIIRPVPDKLNADFLHYLLISKPYKDKLLQTGEAAGATRQAITKSQIQNFRITHPKNIQEQESFVAKLDAIGQETQRLESIYQRKLAALNELKKSLLHEAFSGQL